MVQSQRVPKRTPHRHNSSQSQYRSKPSYQPPPRFQPHRPLYMPPPLRNDFRWQQQSQQHHQPFFIPPQLQFQLPQNNFFIPQPSIPRMNNWGQCAMRQEPIPLMSLPLMSVPYQKHYYEEPKVPINKIIPQAEPMTHRNHCYEEPELPVKQIIPEVEPKSTEQIISDKESANSDSLDKEFENLSMEVIRSNDSSTSNYEKRFTDGPIFETTERPGPTERALPEFDLNDPIFEIFNKSEVLCPGDTIESSLIPDELADGKPFGVFISEVNSPSKFWFHLQTNSQELDDLMFDLE